MSPPEPRRSVLRWAHAVLGAALVAFLIVHLAQCWSLTDDARAFALGAAQRAESGGARRAAIGVLLLIALHAMLALFGLRGRAGSATEARAARELDTVQVTAGLLGAVFVGYHVLHVRALERGPHVGGWDGYGALLGSLGHPAVLLIYVVGVTALCFHVGFGAARFASGTPRGSRGLRIFFGTLGLLLWALWLQPLARLATGAALF